MKNETPLPANCSAIELAPRTVPAERSNAATRAHHPFSPSSLQARENAPCWVPLADTASEASERGTMQHDAVDAAEIPAALTDTEALAVEQCKQFFADRVEPHIGAQVLNEIYVHIDERVIPGPSGKETFKGTTGGYLDRAFIDVDQTYAEIFDWKFGAWSVEPAANNVQGISYLLGLVRLCPTIKTVRVQFMMPHRDEIDWHIFTCDENVYWDAKNDQSCMSFHEPKFADLRLRITTIVERARAATASKDFSKCRASASACLFCGNIAECSVVAAYALKLGKKYAPLLMPDNITPSLVVDPAATRARLEAAGVMATWAQAVRNQETAKCIEDPDWLPADYVLRSRQSTKVIDDGKIRAAALAAGLSQEQIDASSEIALTPLNKALRANLPRGQKDKGEEAFREALVACGGLERGQPSTWLERLKV